MTRSIAHLLGTLFFGALLVFGAFLACEAAAADKPQETRITVREPLPYGYKIGDMLVRELTVMPSGGDNIWLRGDGRGPGNALRGWPADPNDTFLTH